jgi:putative membrane protein insertion efficiency factor
MTRFLIFLVRLYQLILSPFFGGQCRFQPSCSNYSIECLTRFGPLRGSWLTLHRICRCQPFAKGGYDPPPEPDGSQNHHHSVACLHSESSP